MKLIHWKTKHWLIAILALSVLARVAVALYLGDVVDAPTLLTDQRSYHALGIRLLEGHGYSFDQPWYPYTAPDHPTAFWSFGYPLFVAAIYSIFGPHPLAVRLVQGILGGLLLPYVVYRLARRIFTSPSPPRPPSPSPACGRGGGGSGVPFDRTGAAGGGGEGLPLLAAAIAGLYGYFILYAATLMTETLYIIALLWSLDLALRLAEQLQKHPSSISTSLSILLGLSLGLATLLRQSILPWVPVLFLWLLLQGRRRTIRLPNVPAFKRVNADPTSSQRSNVPTFQRSNVPMFQRSNVPTLLSLLLAGLVLLACILPWTYRNTRVYGEFLLLNSNTGYAMYSAQHPVHGTRFSEFTAAPLPQDLAGLNEAQMDRELLRRGFQLILDDPGRYLRLSLSRVRAYFEFWPTPDTTLLHNIGRTGSFGLFLPFMAYGLYVAARNRQVSNPRAQSLTFKRSNVQTFKRLQSKSSSLGLIYLFVVFYSLLHILTWSMVRYRLPIDAVLLPFAALALLDLYTRLRRRIWPREGPVVLDESSIPR